MTFVAERDDQWLARQRAEAIKMRFQPVKIIWRKIQLQKIAQAAIDRVEIRTCTIRCDVIGAAIGILRFGERFLRWKRVHV